jgi:hypothetical protein
MIEHQIISAINFNTIVCQIILYVEIGINHTVGTLKQLDKTYTVAIVIMTICHNVFCQVASKVTLINRIPLKTSVFYGVTFFLFQKYFKIKF